MRRSLRWMLACLTITAALAVAVQPRVAQAGSYAAWAIQVWSARYGLNPAYMVNVADCESSMDPTAYNASSGAYGLFQFTPATYYWLRAGLNEDTTYVPGDFYETRGYSSPAAQAHVAAWAFAHGYGYLWACA